MSRGLPIRVWRAVAVAAAGIVLASCAVAPTPSTKVQFSEADYGVAASPRVVSDDRSVPKGGGRYIVGKPYRVAGKTYVPRDNPNYSAVGLASWYGRNFHGRKTANGEVYDMTDFTAAHPTLPLPSYARVTNLENGRSIMVRVNDRGPFKRGRILDVSSATADILNFKHAGTARVKVEYVGPARLDGHDRALLLASYAGPGQRPPSTMVASAARPRSPAASVVTVGTRTIDFGIASEPMALGPTPAALKTGDPLGPFILRTGLASSYLPTDRFTPTDAHDAASALATQGTIAARAMPVSSSVVQLGAFGDPTNAERLGQAFARYGKVALVERTGGDRVLTVVRVTVPASTAGAVLSAARDAGLSGAFVVAR